MCFCILNNLSANKTNKQYQYSPIFHFFLTFLFYYNFLSQTYSAPALLNYCHAYFLANFTDLLNQNESFRKLLRGNRPHLHDTLSMMQDILTAQIQETYGMKNTSV